MRMEWGQAESTEGPSIQPVYIYTLVLLSVLATLGIGGFRYMRVWTPLERHYLPPYLGSQIAGVVRDNGWYILLQVATRKESRLAVDSDVVPVVPESGENTFALTKEALKQGALRLESQRAYYKNAEMHAYLSNWIYQNQALVDLFVANETVANFLFLNRGGRFEEAGLSADVAYSADGREVRGEVFAGDERGGLRFL